MTAAGLAASGQGRVVLTAAVAGVPHPIAWWFTGVCFRAETFAAVVYWLV
jgi:hypothetical protein